MILHRDGSGRRMGTDPRPASVPEMARVLRNARVARHLDLAAVSGRIGVPVAQLQDLESGTVDRLPDRVAILKALSRYANFLDLPADHFVMTLVEHWPSVAAGAPPVVVVHNGPDLGPAATGLETATVPALDTTAVHHDRAPEPTAALRPGNGSGAHAARAAAPGPRDPGPVGHTTSVGVPAVSGRHPTTAPVPVIVRDTGVTPAVRRSPNDGLFMVFAKALALISAILLLVGVAWLVVNKVHPEWLADLHLPYASNGVGGGAGPTSPPRQSTATTVAPTTVAPTTAPHPTMRFLSADNTQASFAVSAPVFDVRISAQGGDTWVSASGPLSQQPAFEGIVHSGQSQLVSANHQLTVQIGSTAARVAVLVNQRIVGTYVPPGAPFTMTFTTQ